MTRQGIVSFLLYCSLCPIAWPTGNGTCCSGIVPDWLGAADEYYLIAPISEILALPERGT